ncbi:MAG: nitronate monooxygenase, partial [Lachnospiraceae bacterium]|nr:nitronate monooxygenase [Lachnospiraceae bacterium]
EAEGADGISLINTLLAMRIDLRNRRPLLKNGTGGMSGPAVFPVAVRCVYQVREAVSIPVVGLGGVASAEDVIEMMMAGATAVQVGAMNLTEPGICRRIIRELPEAMDRLKITKLKDIIGAAHQ